MAQHTKIQWSDDTVNPTSGCNGCELANRAKPDEASCYAYHYHTNRLANAFKGTKAEAYYAKSFFEVRMIPGRIQQACAWKDLRGTNRPDKPWLNGKPRHIFVGDLSDIFSTEVTDEFLEAEVFAPMESELGKRHVWMVLTKRPERMAQFSRRRGSLPPNVIAMTSATDQATADARVPQLLKVWAYCHGISAEPLRGPLKLAREWIDPLSMRYRLRLVIAGGESGQNAAKYPMELAWVRALLEQCKGTSAAMFVKQLGRFPRGQEGVDVITSRTDATSRTSATVSARYAQCQSRPSGQFERRYELRMSDSHGGDMVAWPADLRLRQMPEVVL